MRWKAVSAPRLRSSRPASSAVTCAASCCRLSRCWRRVVKRDCCSSRADSAVVCSASRCAASSRFCSMMECLASRASLLRAACRDHSCRRLLIRCASASICLSAAPWFAVSLSAMRRSSLRASSCAANSSMFRASAAASVSAWARFFSKPARRPSISRNSRFRARGPSLAGLPLLGAHLLWVGRIIDDIAILELGQKRLEGPTEAIQDADRIFQWRNSRATDGVVAPFEKAALGGIVNQEGGASIDARLQQPYALFGSSPTFDHDIVQLIAQELVDHAFVLAAHFKKIGKRAHGSHILAQRTGLEQAAHRVSGITMVANQGFKGIAPSCGGGLGAAELVCLSPQRVFLRAPCQQTLAQCGDLAFEPAKRFRSGLKAQLGLAALHAKVLQFVPRLFQFSGKAFSLALQGCQAFLGLRCAVARVAGHGQQVHCVAPIGLQFTLRGEDLFG